MTTMRLSWVVGCAVGVPIDPADADLARIESGDTGGVDTGVPPDTGTRGPDPGTAGSCDPGVPRDRTCAVDADCAKVYSDRGYCNCEAVNVSVAWDRDDLDCTGWSGPECDYDCALDPELSPVCDGGTCALVYAP